MGLLASFFIEPFARFPHQWIQ